MKNISRCPFLSRGWNKHWLVYNYETLSPNFGSGFSGIRNGSANHWNVSFSKWPFGSKFVSKKLRRCFGTFVWKMGQGGSINCISLVFGLMCQRLLPVHMDLCQQLCLFCRRLIWCIHCVGILRVMALQLSVDGNASNHRANCNSALPDVATDIPTMTT
jgi:hypothetical protein